MTVYIGTSWKMHKTTAQARSYVRQLNAYKGWSVGLQAFVIPPYTAIATVREEIDASTGVWVGAQNAHWKAEGPYTGEVSMEMVRDVGANLVELGHSERRELYNETDRTVGLKVAAALEAGLTPLVCVGETMDVRREGGTIPYLLDQVNASLRGLAQDGRSKVLVAYEPLWSIGEHGTPASPREVVDVAQALRDTFDVRGLLYGGSVNSENAESFLSVLGIDGLFVGRSAWRAQDLLEVIGVAADHVLRTAGEPA